MRDKVKRFISILMTALMLVNLMPVGALADGITSGGYQQSTVDSYDGTVYVYVKVTGNTEGLVLNNDGWYTIGTASIPHMPDPQYYSHSSEDEHVDYVLSTERPSKKIYANSVKISHTKNTTIPLEKVKWTGTVDKQKFGFVRVSQGAADYVGDGWTWHLDGYVNVEDVPATYTIRYVNQDTGEVLLETAERTGKLGSTITYNDAPETFTYEGKKYTRQGDQERDFNLVNPQNTFDIHYRRQYGYKVEYYYDGVKDDKKTETGRAWCKDVIEEYVDKMPGDGYEHEKTENLPLTIQADESKNVIRVYYKKIGYTVTYKPGEHGTFKTQKHDAKYNDDTPAFVGEKTGEPGWTFAGWAPEVAETVTENVTYTAKWTQNEYKVKYNPGDHGTFDEKDHTYTRHYNDPTPAYDEKNPTAIPDGEPGWTFDGWTPDVTATVTESVTYTAKWTKRTDLSYTVNYYWNGTTEKVADSEIVENQTFEDVIIEEPKLIEGYTPISLDRQELTITTGDNTITFYYYKNVKLTANSATLPYNGEEQSVSGYTCAVAEMKDGSVEYVPWTGEKPLTFEGISASGLGTDVNEKGYPVTFNESPIGEHNDLYYVNESQTGTLTITPAEIKLRAPNASKTYDGKPLEAKTYGHGYEGNTDFVDDFESISVEGSQTLVGSSESTVTYELKEGKKKDNYNILRIPGTLTITPVTEEVIVTITGRTDEMPYDGKEHSVFGYDLTVSNALYNPKEDMQFNGIDGDMTAKGTDAGTYPMGLTAEDFTNKSKNFSKVTFVVTDGYVKINPRAVTLTSETAGKTYDGTALEKPVVTVGGDGFVEGQVKEIKATGSVTNAGSAANTITFTPVEEKFNEKNYNIQKNEGTLTIVKRSVLITSQSAIKTYDGSALTRPAVTITGDGFVPGELAKAEATGSITNVGSTPNAIQYTTTGAFNAANYSIALSVGTLTVTEKPQPEPRRTFNLTINYVYQNGKRAAASYNRGGLKNGETFDITSPVIAGYTASETVVSGTIYNRDIKVTVIYTADGVNLDDYGVPLGLGNITMNVGDCFE